MKKLNRKGFTLIELLAVIVVLAIIIVVTIPSVISSMNNAKTSQLNNAVGTVTEWFTKQYELASLGVGVGDGPSPEFKTFVGGEGKNLTTDETPLNQAVLKAAGITNPTGLSGKVKLNGSKVCVTLTADTTSQFYNAEKANVAGGNTATGSGC